MSKLSVIIPAYNAEDTISAAIESVLTQDWEDYELIIIDDGSVDSTLEVIKRYADTDKRIRLVHRDNGGQAAARGHGLSLSSGEWILFLDSDDTYQPNSFKKLMNLASEENPDVILFGFNIYSKSKLLRTPNAGNVTFQGDDADAFNKIRWLMSSPCNKLYRRDYIKVTFDKTAVHGEDSRFNYQNLVPGTKILSISDCLYNVCLDTEGSVNKRYKKGRLYDTSLNILLQLEVVIKMFSQTSMLIEKIYSEGIDRISTCVTQSQEKLSKADCLDEIKQSKTIVEKIKDFEPCKTYARIDKRILWSAYTHSNEKSVYFIALILNRINSIFKWVTSRD